MKSFANKDGMPIVKNMIRAIQDNKEYLSEVDGAIGDGDHGINMNKGFSICEKRLEGKDFSLSESLSVLGKVLMMEIGGSMGPLYGKFFMGMFKASKEQQTIDKEVFESMIKNGLDGIVEIGNAKIGDKTLLDCLIPAQQAFSKAAADGLDFDEVLRIMKDAAEKGKDSTKDLVAKVGRSSRLGERSRGVLDAGAVSCNLILQAMADSILKLI